MDAGWKRIMQECERIGIKPSDRAPGWFQMWFEDDAGTIRIVRVQIFHNKMPTDTKVIERTHPVEEEVTKDEG